FFILLFRYFTIQFTGEVGSQPLAAKAEQKYSRTGNLEAARGVIYDRNEVVISEDTTSYTLIAVLDKKMTTNPKKPNHVTDPEKTARELANIIDMEESKIYSILTKDQFQVEFGKAGRDISHQTKKEIEALKLPGITFKRDSKRFYPNGIFASHLIGYADRVEEEDGTYNYVGMMGIEKTLNDELTGKDGKINYESDLWGYLLPNGEQKVSPAQNGNDVYLTIDQKIQTFLEDAMNKVVEEYNPKKIIAIVADPKTGDILAMGQRPSFHPKTKEGIDQSWHNEAIETSFEPGSTMKIFTLAAAIEEKKFNPNDLFQSGSYKVTSKDKPIHDHKRSGWGTITYLEGVQRSSNVAFAKIANELLGFDKFREYLTKFGFDTPTGIDLPAETTGKIQYTWPVEKATTAYGQGTAITPIQQIQAMTAIANNGKMMKPQVIDKIVNHDTGEVIKDVTPEVVSTPISAETSKEVRDILETVVTNKETGTGTRYQIDGYSVAGKTGTASIPDPKGGYLDGQEDYIFSFLGMAPKDDPKLIVYVAVQQPEIEHYSMGSIPVSMVFNPVMKNSLQYLNIQPSQEEKASTAILADLVGQGVTKSVKQLEESGLQVVVLGKGEKVTGQLPAADTDVLLGEKIIIKTDGKLAAPDMTGWSLRDVMKVAKISGMKLNSTGGGYVVKQNIKEGAALRKEDFLIVDLKTTEEKLELEAKEAEESTKGSEGELENHPRD
ncbi:penicillin-binding protein, partial [Neobacillus niacini]|uniref:penicillin-binding protein n=1 Tax=Neobacillus niacini TaxID=86668 RepID=UPI002FFDCDED